MKSISTLLALAIVSGTAFAKTESMYTNGYIEDINKETSISYPPSIYKIASQVGEPNFEIFIPDVDKSSFYMNGHFKGGQFNEKSMHGFFFTVTTDKNEYSRVGYISKNSDPSIFYTYTSEKLYSVKLDFKQSEYGPSLMTIKNLIVNSLQKNDYKKTSIDNRNNSENIYYQLNDKVIIVRSFGKDKLKKLSIDIMQKSNLENLKNVELRFESYDRENVERNLGELLKPQSKIN